MTASKQRSFNNWREEYQRKIVSAEEAAKVVKSGDRVVFPNIFIGVTPAAIIARRDELKDVEIQVTAPPYDPGWFREDMRESFKLIVDIFLYRIARPVHDAKRLDFLPYTNYTWWMPYRDERADRREVDVFVTQVSPPDENGFCSFGANIWQRKNYARVAKTVIGEVRENMIRTYGDNSIHVSEIDHFVEVPAPASATDEEVEAVINVFPEERREEIRKRVPGFSPHILKLIAPLVSESNYTDIETALNIDPATEAAKGIAENLKTVLKDGDTIQIGQGRPSKWMVELGVFDNLSDLAIFSEMTCPGMGKLVQRGIVTGKYATLHPGKAVFTGLDGFRWDEMQFANNNPMFELYGSDYVLDISNIAANDNMVAINNGLQVDLVGQITCETQFGSRLINGPGGQIEFHIGAFMSKGGRAVTLLPSTALEGSLSTIVPQLDQGSIVDIPRSYADMVVTEYGVASLSSKTHRERAEALINIAHPDFRAGLKKEAKELFG